ncbi:MAG TPA: prepilin-type N-terminal cleavage/methylation domain-containing protein [Methylomirabilota bacterium]|nr:prepilin-type N-terminal cleavage/methylation domain-containing protein [Methylomirabilota bacterium]
MKIGRESNVGNQGPENPRFSIASCSRPSTLGSRQAFTLIEIMVAIAIIAVIMAIGIPSVYQQMHKDSMRQAVSDISEACSQARARAILNGVATEVRIRPQDRSISAVEVGGARDAMPSYGANLEPAVERSGGGGIFSAKLSDHILIEFIGVNLIPDLQQLDEVSCMFYPNGTSDELVVLIRSDRGEIRKITTEVVTGIADVEVVQ